MKKILAAILVIVIIGNYAIFAESFVPSEWAKIEITEAIGKGFVPEDMQNNYLKNTTRAEFAKMAVIFVAYELKMDFEEAMETYLKTYVDEYGNPLKFQENYFIDIKNSPHAEYIKWANSLRIVYGKGDGIFDPDAFITREEAATMLLRMYFCYGGGVKLGPESVEVENFIDYENVSDWANTAVKYMYQWNVMRGVSKKLYAPKDFYTREQCIVTLERLDRIYN